MKAIGKFLVIFSIMLFILGNVYAGKKDPIGVLFQVKGKVEYTKNGKKWKKVRRNKFLFNGYQLKTGPNASGQVTIKMTGETMNLGPNSLILVTKDGLEAKRGKILAADSSSKLMAGLMKKFSKSQSYTTVRRSAKKNKLKISAIRGITLSNNYPYLVWNNVGAGFDYKLEVGDQIYNIPATQDKVVRVEIKSFSGKRNYKITALKDGNAMTALKPFKRKGKSYFHKITWLEGKKEIKMQKSAKEIQDSFGTSTFMLGTLFERQNLWVAAMDQYKLYLQENPDEIEMTPYLFRVYKKLKLNDIYKEELEEWKTAMME